MILQNSVFAHLALRRAPASSQPPTLALQGPPGHPIRAPKGPPRPPKGTPMDPPDPPWSTSGRPSGISKTCSFMIGKRTNQPRRGSGPIGGRLFIALLSLFFLPPPSVFLLGCFFPLWSVLRRSLGPIGRSRALSTGPNVPIYAVKP
jgi:hypothetical protein